MHLTAGKLCVWRYRRSMFTRWSSMQKNIIRRTTRALLRWNGLKAVWRIILGKETGRMSLCFMTRQRLPHMCRRMRLWIFVHYSRNRSSILSMGSFQRRGSFWVLKMAIKCMRWQEGSGCCCVPPMGQNLIQTGSAIVSPI